MQQRQDLSFPSCLSGRTKKQAFPVDAAEIRHRRERMQEKGDAAWKPAEERRRRISKALRAYAAMTTSASRGAVRQL